jgi:hypothetical protein
VKIEITNPDNEGAGTREMAFPASEIRAAGQFLTGVLHSAQDNEGRLIIEVDCRP